jgi:hypothetical protein
MEKKFACFWQRFDAVTETLKISVFDDLRCFNALVDYCLVVFFVLDIGVYSRNGRFVYIYITW